MAQKVTVLLMDDLDPSLEADETVSFGLDGRVFEIDLSKKNAEGLRHAVAKYVGAARKTSRGRATAPTSSAGARRTDLAQLRAWAASNGVELNTRGRIAAAVTAAYDAKDVAALRAATGTPAPSAKPARRSRAKATPVTARTK